MKKQLLKKFLAFIVTVIIFSETTKAQIVYTDVNPDQTITASIIPPAFSRTDSIDLNNDGNYDFQFSTQESHNFCATNKGNAYLKIISLDSNLVVVENSLVKKISDSTIISSNSLWGNQNLISSRIYNGGCSIVASGWGYFNSGYVGLELKASGLIFYGWVKVLVHIVDNPASASITTLSYAYNSLPNQPILAGETSCTTPTVNLTQSGPLAFCAGDSVTLTANGTGYQYQWKNNNVNIAGATSKTYVAKTAGVYKCKVTNSCGSKTSGIRTVTVPCRNSNENFVEVLEHLSIYPNPATNSVTIKFPSEEAGQIQIVNLFGHVVETYNYTSLRDAEMQIDVSRFSAGMYVVRWSSGENNESKIFSVIK